MAMIISKGVTDFIKEGSKQGNIICLTGAGISEESLVPTFRGNGGLWQKYDPDIFGTPGGLISTFFSSPEKIVNFIHEFYRPILEARPNPAHLALAKMQDKKILASIITQNIDNLHQEAGSQDVIELHGNAFRRRCIHCNKTMAFTKQDIITFLKELDEFRLSRPRLLRAMDRYFPRCLCRGRNRIDIVLFKEELPQHALEESYRQIDKASILLLIGTSGLVYPAAGLPSLAKSKGVGMIEINTESTALSPICNYTITGRAAEVLPQILERLC